MATIVSIGSSGHAIVFLGVNKKENCPCIAIYSTRVAIEILVWISKMLSSRQASVN